MILNNRLDLTFREKLSHYAPALLIYGVVLVMLVYTIWDKNYAVQSKSVRTLGEMLPAYASLAILATLFAILKYSNLSFKKIPVSVTLNEFEEAVKRTAKDRGWHLVQQNENQYQYDTWRGSLMNSNLLITIVLEESHLLFNSIGSLKGRGAISLGFMNKDRAIFLSHLRQVSAQQEYTKAPEMNDTQWNWKMILARIFLYPLSIFFIWISFFHMIPAGNYPLPIIIVAFVFTYLFADLYMIFKGEKTSSEND